MITTTTTIMIICINNQVYFKSVFQNEALLDPVKEPQKRSDFFVKVCRDHQHVQNVSNPLRPTNEAHSTLRDVFTKEAAASKPHQVFYS